MPAVDSIRIRGFKSIRDLEVELRPVNVLIGANGSGKSNFIGAFSFLQEIRSGRLQTYVIRAGGADRVLHFGSRKTAKLSIHIQFENQRNQYEISLTPTADDRLSSDDVRLSPVNEFVYFWDKNRGFEKPFDQHLPGRDGEAGISESRLGIAQFVRGHLDRWRLYHLHDTGLSFADEEGPAMCGTNRFLRDDGTNLAAFLHLLSRRHESSYRLIPPNRSACCAVLR